MKILLLGEYSRLHNSLREGLALLGHEVVIVSTGDGFKGYSSNYSIRADSTNTFLYKKLKGALYKITGISTTELIHAYKFYKLLPQLKGYSHIQLINSNALETLPKLSIYLLQKLFIQNTAATKSLLICGDETPVIDYLLTNKMKYSIISPYKANNSLEKDYRYTLKYTTTPYRNLFNWIKNQVSALITSDLDYEIPMREMGYTTQFIANPINFDAIDFKPNTIENKIVIFLGINRNSYIKKGIVHFENALKIVQDKYPEKVEIIVTENIPYKEYINIYNRAHILLDQVYAYDQGYNALEAMAKGKVVFSGAETEFSQHYKLEKKVAINALPNAADIAKELLYLIENPEEITAIGVRARAFIEKEHNYIKIAAEYINCWLK